MKYRILTIPLMALCLVACSGSGQDDPSIPDPPTPSPDLKSIGFGGNSGAWQDAPASRATGSEGLETLFQSFRVWGYKSTDNTPQMVMDGYNVEYKRNTTEGTEGSTAGSTPSNTAGWEYVGITNTNSKTTQTIKYWDYSATDYRFFAYAPANADIQLAENSAASTTEKSFKIPFTYNAETTTNTTTPYVSDLWFSDNSPENKYGNTVKLTFAPIIAKVRFKFTYPEDAEGISIKEIQFRDSRLVSDPSWAETPLSGNIIATYPLTGSAPVSLSWETSSETGAKGSLIFDTPYEEETDKIQILDHTTENGKPYKKWYYVPPLGNSNSEQDSSPFEQGSYTITAQIDGKETSATVPSAYMQWKAGYQYTYIFKITEAGTNITFTNLQVEQWLTGKEFDNGGSGTPGW